MPIVFDLVIQPLEIDPKWKFSYKDVYNGIIFKWWRTGNKANNG